ncbi:hypothetical protein ACLOJK_030833 [Asimina triloba]
MSGVRQNMSTTVRAAAPAGPRVSQLVFVTVDFPEDRDGMVMAFIASLRTISAVETTGLFARGMGITVITMGGAIAVSMWCMAHLSSSTRVDVRSRCAWGRVFGARIAVMHAVGMSTAGIGFDVEMAMAGLTSV